MIDSLFLSRTLYLLLSTVFLKGRSTTTNLIIYQDDIISAFNRGNQVDSVYIDLSKAFDRISHEHLLAKLSILGVAGTMLRWFRSYVSDRYQVVRYSGLKSTAFPVLSGVPQGSLLGPLLFNIYINDMVFVIRHSKILLFADDAKIYKEITSEFDCISLQADLNSVLLWCSSNKMDVNVSKSSVLTFSRRTNEMTFEYFLGEEPLSRCSVVKDLGVFMTSTLDPKSHLDFIVRRANSALGFIIRVSRDGFSPVALRTLYVQLVRPILEYCSPLWSPYQIGHINAIESIQRKFLRVLGMRLGFHYAEVPLGDISHRFCLQSLSTRRKITDLLLLRKIITSSVDSPDLLGRIDFRCSRLARTNQMFERKYCLTQYSYHSSVPRLHRLGNSLPDHVDFFAMSEVTFKKELSNLFE